MIVMDETSNAETALQQLQGSPVRSTSEESLRKEGVFLAYDDFVGSERPSVTFPFGVLTPCQVHNDNFGSSDQTTNGWIAHMKKAFFDVPEVESIHLARIEEGVDVWVVIPRYDFALLGRLVDLELELLEAFEGPEGTAPQLEFHIVYRCGRDEGEFIPRSTIRISR